MNYALKRYGVLALVLLLATALVFALWFFVMRNSKDKSPIGGILVLGELNGSATERGLAGGAPAKPPVLI